MRRFAKPLYGLTPVPRVRIPPSPPVLLFLLFTARDYQLTTKFQSFCFRRGNKVLEAEWQSHSIARSALGCDFQGKRSGVSSEAMAKRGNPNWGKPRPHALALRTEFEVQVKRLGLTKAEYVTSAALKAWCERNRNRVYIPEWLLKEWRIEVDTTYSHVA